MSDLLILLNGAKGRMGKAILAAAKDENCVITESLDIDDALPTSANDISVAIDFSSHEASAELAAWAASHKTPLVIGTTGHTEDERKSILSHIDQIPVVWAGNYSVGINVLNYLTAKAAAILKQDFNPEVIEMHHRHKKDSPSGTAERLIQILKDSYQLSDKECTHGRKGLVGARPDNEIGVHAIRGGDIIGEHTVLFAGEGERIELTHRAGDRKIFAAGAIRAAHWIKGKAAGLYSMEDVLDLK